MDTNTKEYFYWSWRKPLAIIFFALFSLIIYKAIKIEFYEYIYLGVLNLLISVGGVWFFSSVSLTNQGMRLYVVNHLKWEEIESARFTKFFGLPYILIKRNKGLTWWLPLYYKGNRSLKNAILEKSPQGNPIREALSS